MSSSNSRLLVGLGILIVGLLSGVLLSLWVIQPASVVGGEQDEVRSVQLGAPEVPAYDAAPTPSLPIDVVALNEAFKSVSSRVRPSVVFIEVSGSGGRNWFHRDRGFPQSVGSGVVVSPDGYVVTNNHVVEGARSIEVTLADKRRYSAEVVGADAQTDLAVIRLKDGSDLPAIRLGDSDAVQVGEWVLAVGNPFRLTSTVTAGIVSALGRQVNIIDDSFGIESFIQTDAAINPGNSGGALVNLEGELVGIATAIATESGAYEGYGFAVPSNLMQRVVRDLIDLGEVQRGYLGVEIWAIDARRADELGLESITGVYLANVRRGLAAHQAGLRSGDVLLSIGGREVSEPNELQSSIALYRPGEQIDVKIWRRGSVRDFGVTLTGRDSPASQNWFAELSGGSEEAQPPESDRAEPPAATEEGVESIEDWGFGVLELSERYRQMFRVQEGIYVAYVESGSVAEIAGLPRHSVLVRIDGESVDTVEQVRAALERAADRGEAALLEVRRRRVPAAYFELELPESISP